MLAFKRIVDFVHASGTGAKIGMQLGHSGPKGSTQVGWEAPDEPLPEGNWPLLAASALAYGPTQPGAAGHDARRHGRASRPSSSQSTRRAAEAGFDWLELHCAHGYLLSSFITPLTNQRTDDYGGSLENRCRYPLEVFSAMREVWPAHLPMSVRISAHDWAPGGNTADDAVEIARLFKAAGCDVIDVSSGQTTRAAKPVYGRMYQTPFADRIRNEVGIQTMAVGAISEADHVNSIIAAGRADLCAIARPHLADPAWTLHEAAKLQSRQVDWPQPYLSGRDQLYREISKQNKACRASSTSMRRPAIKYNSNCRRSQGTPMDLEARGHSEHPEALRLWLRMLTCTQLIEKQVRSQLREQFDTTLPRFDLMAQLERKPDGLKMNELSRRMMVTGGNVTGITDQLVAEGLVERVDGRRRPPRLPGAPDAARPQPVRRHGAPARRLDRRRLRRPVARAKSPALHQLLGKVKQHSQRPATPGDTHETLHRPGQPHARAVRCAGQLPRAQHFAYSFRRRRRHAHAEPPRAQEPADLRLLRRAARPVSRAELRHRREGHGAHRRGRQLLLGRRRA